jgi:cell division protein ZapA (FtsZ GTPase activity inhibitor)
MIIEISIGNQKYKINCRQNEVEDILEFADRLDRRIKELQHNIENVSDSHYLVVAGLMLEQELQQQIQDFNQKTSTLYTEDDLYEAISEQMDNVSYYIENIISKIEKL